MNISTDKKNLLELVKWAQEAKLVLPEFQRDFVWSRDDVRDLLVSILNGYYIGSFLLLRTDAEHLPFQPRLIAGVTPVIGDMRPDYMVLDGQQRMTSLHYAFAAPPVHLKDTRRPYRYFLDLTKVRDGDLDEAISYEREDRCSAAMEKLRQFETFVIPFTEVPRFEDWLTECDDWYHSNDRDRYENVFRPARPAWRAAVRRFEDFPVPTVEIDKVSPTDGTQIAKVCAIFEKLNSTGISLSVFDLLTARLYPVGIRLRDLWTEAYEASERLQRFATHDPYGYQVLLLRTIGLMRGMDVKGKTLIGMEPEKFEDDWYRAVTILERALQRMQSTNSDGFGVFDPKWLPYSTMLPVLAALLQYIEDHKLGEKAFRCVRKWYWGSVFLERYAGSVESITYRDYHDLIKRFHDDDFVPAIFREIDEQVDNNATYSVRKVIRVNAVYRGVMSLVAIRGAKDFRTGQAIEFHNLEDHHLFPSDLLRSGKLPTKRRYASEAINTIVNRTLISDDTNRLITAKLPSRYLTEDVSQANLVPIMESHFIGQAALDALRRDDYESFLEHREAAILEYLRRQLTIDGTVS